MASYTVNIPASDVPRVLAGFNERFNYNANKLDLAVPTSADPEPDPVWETEIQFAKRQLNNFIFETMEIGERRAVQTAAHDAMVADIRALNITTT